MSDSVAISESQSGRGWISKLTSNKWRALRKGTFDSRHKIQQRWTPAPILDKVFVRKPSILSEFPQELVDAIVEYLWNDRPALRRCALVSRSFLWSVQTVKFRRITQQHLVRPIDGIPPGTYLSANPHLLSHIRELKLTHRVTWCLGDKDVCLALEVIHGELDEHGRYQGPGSLRKVTLRTFKWHHASPQTQTALIRLLSCESLTAISFQDINLPQTVLESFPIGLRSLKLKNVHLDLFNSRPKGGKAKDSSHVPRALLESLIVRGLSCTGNGAFELFFTRQSEWAIDIEHLSTLGFYVEISKELGAQQALMQCTSKSLKELCLGFAWYYPFAPLNFAQFPNLQRFSIIISDLYHFNNFAQTMTWLADSLESTPSKRTIRTLGIRYDISLKDASAKMKCDPALWERLDLALERSSNFGSDPLPVAFWFMGSKKDIDGYVNYLQDKLPRLLNGNRLSLEFTPPDMVIGKTCWPHPF